MEIKKLIKKKVVGAQRVKYMLVVEIAVYVIDKSALALSSLHMSKKGQNKIQQVAEQLASHADASALTGI